MSRGSNDINKGGGHVLDVLSAYIDGALDAGELESVRAHVADCEECNAEYLELRATKQMLSALPTVAPPRAFTLTQEMVAPRSSFWDRVLNPRAAPRLATGSVLAFALLIMILIGDSGVLSRTEATLSMLTAYAPEPKMVPAAGGVAADSTATTATVDASGATNLSTQSAMTAPTPAAQAAGTAAAGNAAGGTILMEATPVDGFNLQNFPAPPANEDAERRATTGSGEDARGIVGPDEGYRGYIPPGPLAHRDDGRTALLIVEATLALLAIVFAVGAFLARRST